MNKKLIFSIFGVLVLVIIGFFIFGNNKDNIINIKTDKFEYNQGEEVKINIDNSGDKKIHYLPLSFNLVLERYEDSKWVRVPQRSNEVDVANCLGILFEAPNCNEEAEYFWDQEIIQCAGKQVEGQQASSGKYRFQFSYWEDECWGEKEKIIYSNEFTIK